MRLDRYLSENGLGSRETVKKLIRNGQITVSGAVKTAPETSVSEDSEIYLNGERLQLSRYVYLMLNKPAGYVTARSDEKKKTVMELIDSKRRDLSPVGRLDEDTEGLLLFTDDGELNHKLTGPKYHVAKKYYVRTDRKIPENAEAVFGKPMVFQDFTAEPGIFERIGEDEAYLTIFEGKFHQVKRMFHQVGCEVSFLKRVSFGPLELGDLPAGTCRPLTDEEIARIKGVSKDPMKK